MAFFEVALVSFIDMNHELVQLSKAIDWLEVESEFSGYYCSDNYRPGVPIRKMVGLMLLKNIYDLSDEEVVARWMGNSYMQYFTGETVFQNRPPINPADFSKFRKRIGKEGAEKLFRMSLTVNAKELARKEMKQMIVNSTAQEENIAFPTDTKLNMKVIEKVRTIADKEEIELRRSYTHELKALNLKIRFINHPTRYREGVKAVCRMRLIARAMVNDLSRKLSAKEIGGYGSDIALYLRVINQERTDKDKIYSLHEPEVECISKGKDHRSTSSGTRVE